MADPYSEISLQPDLLQEVAHGLRLLGYVCGVNKKTTSVEWSTNPSM